MSFRRVLAALLLSLLVLSGCGGGGHHATTPKTTTSTAPTGSVCSSPGAPGGRLFCDPEPQNLFSQSIGRMPGTSGPNGSIHPTAPIVNGVLARAAAASWNSMNLYARRYHHVNVLSGTDDATLRSYDRQVYWRDYWCGQGHCENAAVPGTSNHGWGRAVDLYNCSYRGELDRIGRTFGWRWGEVDYECWHVTMYAGGWPHGDPGADYNNPILCHGSGGPGQDAFVKDVQHALTRKHFTTKASGFVTVGTVQNLRRFQRAHHIPVHSCTDRRTWKELRKR